MLLAIEAFFRLLTSPTLASQILVGASAVATNIVVVGIGIWSIVGAWKVLMFLIRART